MNMSFTNSCSFFNFCNRNSRQFATEEAYVTEDTEAFSEDDACPPPIKRNRDAEPTVAETSASEKPSGVSFQDSQAKASSTQSPSAADELGQPQAPLLTEPITSFSARNFLSSINYLRVMQKICKNKAHRNLLLVQYKSSNILKKALRVPQKELRLYTLKLFKNQVPYCGRKWRQGNMRVITAVYLHCRPELRDDWLAGSDVDAEVEEALPLEQALRGLTHWYNVKHFPDAMGDLGEADIGFFARELEKMEWDEDGAFGDESVEGSVWEGAQGQAW
jgi:hypothetical protein